MHFVLIQPRYQWGRHIYLPNGLLSLAARLLAAGHTATIIDENLDDLDSQRAAFARADYFCLGVLGPPYLPAALRVATWLRQSGYAQPLIFGGELVNRLTATEKQTLFVDRFAQAGTNLPCLLAAPEGVSMSPALRALPEYMQAAYFSREWCLYTSQGCAFKCHPCAASKGQVEKFRDLTVLDDETKCLAELVHRYAGPQPNYQVYLSSLDACQTPKKMDPVLALAARNFAASGVVMEWRCLATAKCTVMAVKHDPELLKRWRQYGLCCIAIGADGDDAEDWSVQNNRHNTTELVNQSLALIRAADMLPEALMVFGFPGSSPKSLVKGFAACTRFSYHGYRARPYLGKAHLPGTEYWAQDRAIAEQYLANPETFLEIDFGSLGSSLTHANPRQRYAANVTYFATVLLLKAFSYHGCPTQPLLPTVTIPRPLRPLASAWNRLLPADK